MKNHAVWVLMASFAALSRADDGGDYQPESRSAAEVFTSKVVKVYSFEEGDAEYTSYVVTWKGHEVVVAPVAPTLDEKRHQVGDVIRCRMQQMDQAVGDRRKARMVFYLSAQFTANPVVERARLEAIQAAVEARRAAREAAEARLRPPSP